MYTQNKNKVCKYVSGLIVGISIT